MALIKCPECNKEISDTAETCIHCGCKLKKLLKNISDTKEDTADVQPKASVVKKSKKSTYIIIGAIIVVLVALVIVLSTGKEQNFRNRYPSLKDKYWCEISEDGSWMKIEASGHEQNSMIETVNKDLGLSGTIYEDMMSTRLADGKQTYEDNKVSIVWRYYDKYDKLEVIYELKKPTKYISPPDILTQQQCVQFEEELLNELSFANDDMMLLVSAYENSLFISLDLNDDSSEFFVSSITEFVEKIPPFLEKYKIPVYSISFYSNLDEEKDYISWVTSDLKTGYIIESKNGEIDFLDNYTAYTIDELQEKYGCKTENGILTDDQREQFKENLISKLSFKVNYASIVVNEEGCYNISVDLKNDFSDFFVSSITELAEVLPSLLNEYRIENYFLAVYSDFNSVNSVCWSTTNLERGGVLFDYSNDESNTLGIYSLTELQENSKNLF